MEPHNYYSTRYLQESTETQSSQSQGQQPNYRLIFKYTGTFQTSNQPSQHSVLSWKFGTVKQKLFFSRFLKFRNYQRCFNKRNLFFIFWQILSLIDLNLLYELYYWKLIAGHRLGKFAFRLGGSLSAECLVAAKLIILMYFYLNLWLKSITRSDRDSKSL